MIQNSWPQEAETANSQLIANLRLFSLEVQGGADPQAQGAGQNAQGEDEGDAGEEDLTALQAELSKQVVKCAFYTSIVAFRCRVRRLRTLLLCFAINLTDWVERLSPSARQMAGIS